MNLHFDEGTQRLEEPVSGTTCDVRRAVCEGSVALVNLLCRTKSKEPNRTSTSLAAHPGVFQGRTLKDWGGVPRAMST